MTLCISNYSISLFPRLRFSMPALQSCEKPFSHDSVQPSEKLSTSLLLPLLTSVTSFFFGGGGEEGEKKIEVLTCCRSGASRFMLAQCQNFFFPGMDTQQFYPKVILCNTQKNCKTSPELDPKICRPQLACEMLGSTIRERLNKSSLFGRVSWKKENSSSL